MIVNKSQDQRRHPHPEHWSYHTLHSYYCHSYYCHDRSESDATITCSICLSLLFYAP